MIIELYVLFLFLALISNYLSMAIPLLELSGFDLSTLFLYIVDTLRLVEILVVMNNESILGLSFLRMSYYDSSYSPQLPFLCAFTAILNLRLVWILVVVVCFMLSLWIYNRRLNYCPAIFSVVFFLVNFILWFLFSRWFLWYFMSILHLDESMIFLLCMNFIMILTGKTSIITVWIAGVIIALLIISISVWLFDFNIESKIGFISIYD